MKLSALVASEFAPDVRRRGQDYYRTGQVHITEGSARRVRAIVRGTSRYEITLSREDDLISGDCNCPYTDSYGAPCKHLWATLLAAEDAGYLFGNGNNRDLSFDLLDPDYGDDFDEDDDDLAEFRSPRAETVQKIFERFGQTGKLPGGSASWKKVLGAIESARQQQQLSQPEWPAGRQLIYIVDVPSTLGGRGLIVEVATRERRKTDGEWGKLKSYRIPSSQLQSLPDPLDQRVMASLLGAKEHYTYSNYYYGSYQADSMPIRYQLPEAVQPLILPQMCETGRCFLKTAVDQTDFPAVAWDEGELWQFNLKMSRDEAREQYVITGLLRRDGPEGEEQMSLTEPVMLTLGGLVFTGQRAARFDHGGAFQWIPHLRQHGAVVVPFKQGQDFVEALLKLSDSPPLLLPEELQYEEVSLTPQPGLKLKPDKNRGYSNQRVRGELLFNYDGQIVPRGRTGRGAYDAASRRLLLRDKETEQTAFAQLTQLGFREQRYYNEPNPVLELTASRVPRVVRELVSTGWQVEAEGKLYRRPGNFEVKVSSGIDWFELHGTVDFEGATATLPELLAALKRGENTVRLGDGTFGLLPEEWLKKYGMIAGLGTAEGDHVRFTRAQAGLLDALLASQPEATFDANFARVREELKSFEGIEPTQEPAGFTGELRGYQREALGWLHFLRRFGFGGCLADDMGLGKTLMALALLEARREQRADKKKSNGHRPAPSLVVVPKSLVFNWKQEAARFTPRLRVLDHTGQFRQKDKSEHFEDYDLILTTYGTLRNDAVLFKDVRFDYVILDEAQAIKNADTESAKAARLLKGDYKLALSGTPIENHLGELWSLFDFLNPGLLGSASVLNLGGAAGRNPDEETRKMLAQALRPFILRRTKDQVAKDLPQKLEQTIFCELESAQRKRYNDLREHYRKELLNKIEADGLNKSKMVILEALLRLRQAACHPGLIDKNRVKDPSAKLDVLLPQLAEVIAEGHKTLVFSQFTSLLSIVRDRLENEGITYEYLDGKTRNRQARVERFQTDPDCKLFLISLKAGGLGLNLTAAEYVFLLDPWWNPAVEAQAIDRAHRIGQTKQVFAYRLIAKDTVEEKVLELQNTKRDLADAIINADNSLIRNLKREDLELLLS
ncbi:MAG TPA: SNF2-related protein [Blastocatellia bacterium]|nr:SNF2-related protein [Blastocatellia bacterium]